MKLLQKIFLIGICVFSLNSYAQQDSAKTKLKDWQKSDEKINNPSQKLSQRSGYPNSIASISVGIGSNYGGIGTKAVIGYRNSGFLLGLGDNFNLGLGYNVGAQISDRWWYASIAYGTIAGNYNGKAFYGFHFMTGGMINLDKRKRYFLDIGAGLNIDQYHELYWGINFGIGTRIGNIVKK